jgi:hypothetical protein
MEKEHIKKLKRGARGSGSFGNTVYMGSDTTPSTLGSHDSGFRSQQRTPSEPIPAEQHSGQRSVDKTSRNHLASDFNDPFVKGPHEMPRRSYYPVINSVVKRRQSSSPLYRNEVKEEEEEEEVKEEDEWVMVKSGNQIPEVSRQCPLISTIMEEEEEEKRRHDIVYVASGHTIIQREARSIAGHSGVEDTQCSDTERDGPIHVAADHENVHGFRRNRMTEHRNLVQDIGSYKLSYEGKTTLCGSLPTPAVSFHTMHLRKRADSDTSTPPSSPPITIPSTRRSSAQGSRRSSSETPSDTSGSPASHDSILSSTQHDCISAATQPKILHTPSRWNFCVE